MHLITGLCCNCLQYEPEFVNSRTEYRKSNCFFFTIFVRHLAHLTAFPYASVRFSIHLLDDECRSVVVVVHPSDFSAFTSKRNGCRSGGVLIFF